MVPASLEVLALTMIKDRVIGGTNVAGGYKSTFGISFQPSTFALSFVVLSLDIYLKKRATH
jgi:ribose/xylose/arabinose/galactoside ABC-type transport system permease subunit